MLFIQEKVRQKIRQSQICIFSSMGLLLASICLLSSSSVLIYLSSHLSPLFSSLSLSLFISLSLHLNPYLFSCLFLFISLSLFSCQLLFISVSFHLNCFFFSYFSHDDVNLFAKPSLALSARVRGPWPIRCWANMFASCKKNLSRYSCASLAPRGVKWACISAGRNDVLGVVWLWCCFCLALVVLFLLHVCCRVVDCRQTWRHHVATFKRVTVILAVCQRLFEILTTLTFGAQRRNNIVSTALETVSKKTEMKKARCPRAISNLSRIVKSTTEVGREVRQCWCRCVG